MAVLARIRIVSVFSDVARKQLGQLSTPGLRRFLKTRKASGPFGPFGVEIARLAYGILQERKRKQGGR